MIIKTGIMKTTVFVTMVLFFLVTGCKKQDHAELTAQEWQLKEMSGLSSKPEKMPTLLFTDSTALYGFAGCNRFFGTYTVEGKDKLKIKVGGVTMMFCPDMAVEDQYLTELKRIASYHIEPNLLQLKDSAGTIRMTFIPKDKVKQLGVSEDRQGCNEAAGYTWSEVRKSCIRLFESGVQLTSVKDTAESLAAYIVFSADSLQAEVFVPNMDIHPILERRNLPIGRYAWNQEDDDSFNIRQVGDKWIIDQANSLLYHQSR